MFVHVVFFFLTFKKHLIRYHTFLYCKSWSNLALTHVVSWRMTSGKIIIIILFIPSSSFTCSFYMSRAVCRFVMLSPALNTDSKTVFLMELGWRTLQSCKLYLKLPCPLSPPNLTHSLPKGIAPSCQLRPLGELHVYHTYCVHSFFFI